MSVRPRQAILGLLSAFIAVRYMLFAAENIDNFAAGTERFRRLVVTIREHHPDPSPGTHIPVDAATVEALQFRYVEALIQWEFRDPTLKLVVRP